MHIHLTGEFSFTVSTRINVGNARDNVNRGNVSKFTRSVFYTYTRIHASFVRVSGPVRSPCFTVLVASQGHGRPHARYLLATLSNGNIASPINGHVLLLPLLLLVPRPRFTSCTLIPWWIANNSFPCFNFWYILTIIYIFCKPNYLIEKGLLKKKEKESCYLFFCPSAYHARH